MAEVYGSIAGASGEHPSRDWTKLIRQGFLVTFGFDEKEIVGVLQVGTVLQFQGHRLRESLRKGHPVDPTDQLCVIWELVVTTQAGLNTHGEGRSAWLQGT